MSQLVESIRIYNGRVYNIHRHNARCNRSRSALFEAVDKIDLRSYINVPNAYINGLVKCRIIYDKEVRSVKFAAYEIRRIDSLAIIEEPNVNYNHKKIDRKQLDDLKSLAQDYDEIIITKNGLITDAYYYNVVLQVGQQYFTPKSYLLGGVMRQKLLARNRIIERQLNLDDLQIADSIYLINALTPLGKIKLNPNQAFIIKR